MNWQLPHLTFLLSIGNWSSTLQFWQFFLSTEGGGTLLTVLQREHFTSWWPATNASMHLQFAHMMWALGWGAMRWAIDIPPPGKWISKC